MAEDSSGIQYQDAPEGLPEKNGTNIPKGEGNGDNPGNAEKSDGGEVGGTGTETETGSEEDSEGGSTGGGSGSGDKGNGDKQPAGDGTKSGGKAGLGESSAVPTEKKAANVTPADDSGGSSALVPILIALAAVAAIAIGAVVYRQKRQSGDSDAPVSPKAS